MYFNKIEVLKGIRKRFWNNTLTKEDLEYVTVLENRDVEYYAESLKHFKISFGNVFWNGELEGFLDRRTRKQFGKVDEIFKADILVIKVNTKIFKDYLMNGFYHFNPHRSLPDSVVSIKKII